MDVSNIGMCNSMLLSGKIDPSLDEGSEQFFIHLLKESPAEQMVDMWLLAHHLTRQELASLPPKKREALEQQMQHDIKREIELKTKQKDALAEISVIS